MEGNGFHTGVPNRLRVTAGAPGRGVARIGSRTHVVWGAQGGEAQSADRCTSVAGIGPLEHLSAAAIALGVRGWELEADHEDLPLFDGSAGPWAKALRSLGSPATVDVRECGLQSHSWEGTQRGSLEIEPSDHFELLVEWSFGPSGPELWHGDASDLEEILPARTFIDADQWWRAKSGGLLRGAGLDSGRLFAGKGPLPPQCLRTLEEEGVDTDGNIWTGGAQRVPMECAAHKALDLVGDIGCAIGYLPAIRILARDAGHALHAELCRALRAAHRD